MEDASRLRDALGTPLPVGCRGLPRAGAGPLGDLVARFARTHGPFTADGPPAGWVWAWRSWTRRCAGLQAAGRVVEGSSVRTAPVARWIDAEVLRRLRSRSLAAYRGEVEPAPPLALARFLAAWQGVGPAGPRRADAMRCTDDRTPPGSAAAGIGTGTVVLPVRLPGYTPSMLDELCASGEVVWAGAERWAPTTVG
jgi:ATP-dependent Lhr-like helicase